MKRLLWVEMIGIFIGIPLLLEKGVVSHHKIIVLLFVCILCLALLLNDKSFGHMPFGLNGYCNWQMVSLRFVIIACCLTLYTILVEPSHIMELLRQSPTRWALIMITYPLFSVVPQELIYRAFYFHRYGSLFMDKRKSVILNALLFAFAHIIFKNWVAVVGAFVASFLWATTYLRSRSLLVVSIEHAIYGNFVFTLGIGYHIYSPDF